MASHNMQYFKRETCAVTQHTIAYFQTVLVDNFPKWLKIFYIISKLRLRSKYQLSSDSPLTFKHIWPFSSKLETCKLWFKTKYIDSKIFLKKSHLAGFFSYKGHVFVSYFREILLADSHTFIWYKSKRIHPKFS